MTNPNNMQINPYHLMSNPGSNLNLQNVPLYLEELPKRIEDNARTSLPEKIKNISLESLLLNTDTLKKSLGIIEKPKMLTPDQIYAATISRMTEIDNNLVNSFLMNQGLNITHFDKSVADLKSFVRTHYDLKKAITLESSADKFMLKDKNIRAQKEKLKSFRSNLNDLYLRKLKKKETYTDILVLRGITQEGLSPNRNMQETSVYNNSVANVNQLFTGTQPRQTYAVHTPLKTKTFDTGLKFKQTEINLNNNYTMSDNIKRTDNISINNEDEKSSALFDNYFESMKILFYYKVKKEILPECSGFILSPTEIQNFNNENKLLNQERESNFYPVALTVNHLEQSFKRDPYRQSLFSLLNTMLDPVSKDTSLSTERMLSNSIKFYEEKFLQGVILSNSEVMNLNPIDDARKLSDVDSWVRTTILSKFSSQNKLFEYSNSLLLWGKIYSLMRCGLNTICLRLMVNSTDHEIKSIAPYFEAFLRNDNLLDEKMYGDLALLLRQKTENAKNPFRHACLSLLTKIQSSVPDNLFDSLEDYVWFHLKLIQLHPSIELFKQRNQTLQYVNLKQFQDYILRGGVDNFEKHANMHLDYCKCLFSILLFEEGVHHLSHLGHQSHLGQYHSQNSNHIDAVNLGLLLANVNLLKNFNVNNEKPIEQGDSQLQMASLQTSVDYILSTFMRSRFFEVLNYSNAIYLDTDRLVQLFTQTGYYSALIKPAEVFFQIGKFKLTLFDVLNKRDIVSLVEKILTKALQIPSKSEENFSLLLKLAAEYKDIPKLLYLIISDYVEIITQKTPSKIFRNEVHSKPSVHNPSKLHTDTRSAETLSTKHRENLNVIGSNKDKLDKADIVNFRFLRQLETIEEIYVILSKDDSDESIKRCLSQFINTVNLIPFKNEKETRNYLTEEYGMLFEGIKNIIPDVAYLAFYLMSSRVKHLTKIPVLRNENISKNSISDLSQLKSDLSNLMNVLEELRRLSSEKYNSRLKVVLKEVSDFTLKN